MWEKLLSWATQLFVRNKGGGPRGDTSHQLGAGNQALRATTSGHGSPVVTAGGDAHVVVLYPGTSPSQSVEDHLEDIESLMADLLDDLREGVFEHPLVRDVVVMSKSSFGYNWSEDHFCYADNTHPDARAKFRLLEDRGLVSVIAPNPSPFFTAYRLGDELVRLLKRRPPKQLGGAAESGETA